MTRNAGFASFGIVAALSLLLPAGLSAQQPAAEEGRGRFAAIDLFVDSGKTPLAAYQVEFMATNGVVQIAGIEGGEAAAFKEPPAYDPKAMQRDRVVLAGFSTSKDAALPSGIVRIATVHIRVSRDRAPGFELRLHAAADSTGRRIAAKATYAERERP